MFSPLHRGVENGTEVRRSDKDKNILNIKPMGPPNGPAASSYLLF